MDDNLLPARVRDAVSLCSKTDKPQFLGFLSPGEKAICLEVLKSCGGKYVFWGGYTGSERSILGLLPDWCDESAFPIAPVTFTYKKEYSLSHRDFLGALMSLGIERECVGDILLGTGKTVVFLKQKMSDFVLSQITKVGSVGVTLSSGFTEPLPGLSEPVLMSGTVASRRLDCIVSLILSVSRNSANEYIEGGLVSLDGISCQKPTHFCVGTERVTVKGRGRFDLVSLDGISKKGRVIAHYKKYV